MPEKYLNIYPPNLVKENSPLGDLKATNRNHFHSDHYTSAATDDTSHISQFPFVHTEQRENCNTCYIGQSPACTSPNQTQFSPNQVSFSSTQGLSSPYGPQSPKLYTTEMHPLPINTTQSQLPSAIYCELSSEPPPISKFLSTDQGSIISAPTSSVSSHKPQGSSFASQISSPFNSITKGSPTHSAELHTSLKQPTASRLQTSSLASPVSCNQKMSQVNIPTIASPHSPLELKGLTPLPSHYCLQVNPSMIQSETHSPLCISSTLEIPVTSPPSGYQTKMLLNSSLRLPKQCLGFQLPQSQSSPCHCNRASSGTFLTVKSQLPSIQYPENAPGTLQEMKINLNKMDIESSGVQGAQIQEAPAKTDLLYPSLTEGGSLEKCLMNNNSCGKFNSNEKIRDNILISYQSTKREGFICEGWKTSNSSGRRVLRKNLQGNLVVDKCPKTENVRGESSRREGLLTEISKTGILLVERAKKERLVSKLLNEGSNSEVLLSRSPKIENMQFGEISLIKDSLDESLSIEDSLTGFSKEKDLRGEAIDEDASLVANSTISETKNLGETLSNKSSWESILLASYKQEEMLDLDMLGGQTYGTNLLKPDGIDYELDSVQFALDQVLDKISRRNASPRLQGQEHESKMIDPVVIDSQSKSGNWGGDTDYIGTCKDDSLNKNLMTEHAGSLNRDFLQQIRVGGWWGEKSNGEDILAVQEKQMILDESICGITPYNFSKISSSVYPNVESRCIQSPAGELLEGGHQTKDLLIRNLKRRGSEDKSLGNRFRRESSSDRVNGLQEPTLNEVIPLSTQSTTNHLLSGNQSSGFAQCSSRMKVDEEDQNHINNLPEELSSLLEMFPAILPEWNDQF